MYHCQKCNNCIDFHHKHSEFLGKCIGRGNAIAYFWFLLTNTIFNIMAVCCLINCINMTTMSGADEKDSPSGIILGLVACLVNIYEQNMIVLGSALFLTTFLMLENFDKLLQVSISVSNGATMREMSDLWMHVHHFKPVVDAVDALERLRIDLEVSRGLESQEPEEAYKYMFKS